MAKFKNKYRIESSRAQWWDYGSNAAYFITICTNDRIHFFGEIVNQEMQLTELGKQAEWCWYQIPEHFPFVKLGAFVVMPDHIHGIVIIDKPVPVPVTETQNVASRQKNKFGPQSKNLGSILRGFKIGVTNQSKLICPKFKWQPLFHDHIIRDKNEYQRIHNYIIANPKNWGKPKKGNRK
jgi:REP element-mobilizing transposase RayT